MELFSTYFDIKAKTWKIGHSFFRLLHFFFPFSAYQAIKATSMEKINGPKQKGSSVST
jgi:hypothetical protein